MHMGMDLEVSGSNAGGVKYFSTRLSFESNSSEISRFMFSFEIILASTAFKDFDV